MDTILGTIVGALVSWLLSSIYYRRGAADLRSIVDQLPTVVVAKLSREAKRKLSIDELEELIHEAGAFAADGGLFPNSCPKCGSTLEYRESMGNEMVDPEMYAECLACGWRR